MLNIDMKIPVNIAIALSMFAILALDIISPLGVAAGTPYGLVVLATLWTKKINETYLVAAASIVLTILGFFLSPDIVSTMSAVVINRLLAVCIIAASAILVIKHKKAFKHIQNLNRLITTDPLTGVNNRLGFDRAMNQEIARDIRYQRNMSLAILDIDFLKKINDTYGHVRGDDIIKSVAHDIRDTIRQTDYLCRIGGDEFAIIFTETNIEKAQGIAKEICNRISQNPVTGDPHISVSIGIAKSDKNDDKDSLYQRADEALYISKKQGRNMVTTIPNITEQPARERTKKSPSPELTEQ